MTRRVLAVAASDAVTGSGDRMTDLVQALRTAGVEVEIVSTGRRATRTVRRGPSDRRDTAVLLGDRVPQFVGRRFEPNDHRVAVVASDPWTVPTDAAAPVPWVVFSERQRTAMPLARSASAVVVPPVRMPSPGGAASSARDGAVVVLSAGDLWSRPDHAIELVARLAVRLPEVPLRWVVQGEDRWLAQHDLVHAGLADRVPLIDLEGLPLQGARLVVRPGVAGAVPALVAAAEAGVPVSFMAGEDVPLSAPWIDPFDVEALVADVVELAVNEPAARRRAATSREPRPHARGIEALRLLLDV